MKKSPLYSVYIDEAGDLGVKRGTKWFVLSAVIVKKEDEKNIRETMSRIKTKLNINKIHIREVRDFYKRAYITRELSTANFVYMNVVCDTYKFDSSKIPTPIIAYNFICKYLLQRISWYLETVDAAADVVLSARGSSRDNELIQYINEKLLTYNKNHINPVYFNKIGAKSSGEWDLLQLADVCATTLFLAHEPSSLGYITPCFSHMLYPHLFKKKEKLMYYGVQYFQDDMKPVKEELKSKWICAKK